MHKNVESLDAQVDWASDYEIKRSEAGNWIFNFIFTSSQGPIIIKHGGGGWRTLEDHMIFRGKGRGISRRRQRLKGGGGEENVEIDYQF